MIWYVLAAFLCLAASSLQHRAASRTDDDSSMVAAGNAPGTTADNGTAGTMDVFRLPDTVVPLSYALRVATDFENMTYSGRVDIVIQTTASTNRIVMNAKEVQTTEVNVIDQKTNENLPLANFSMVDKNEQLVIALNKSMISSRFYLVNVTFKAPLRDDMSGYYKSSYRENNVTKYDSSISLTTALYLYATGCKVLQTDRRRHFRRPFLQMIRFYSSS